MFCLCILVNVTKQWHIRSSSRLCSTSLHQPFLFMSMSWRSGFITVTQRAAPFDTSLFWLHFLRWCLLTRAVWICSFQNVFHRWPVQRGFTWVTENHLPGLIDHKVSSHLIQILQQTRWYFREVLVHSTVL